MMLGRISIVPLLQRLSAPLLFSVSLVLTLPGFLLYWGGPRIRWQALPDYSSWDWERPLLYPFGPWFFAIGVAGELRDIASAP